MCDYLFIVIYMLSQLLSSTIIFTSAIIASSSAYSGDLTSYGAAPENQFCGFKSSSWNYNGLMTAALNAPMMNESLSCGLCAAVSYEGKNHAVLIDNICPECRYGDLDLSNQAWQAIVGNSNYGRMQATWEFIECDQFLLPDKQIVLKPHHINYWWLSVVPSGMKCGVSEMYISFGDNWIGMKRSNELMNGLYFIYHEHITGKFKFKLVSALGDEIETDWYDQILETFETKKQFECITDCSVTIANTPVPSVSSVPLETPACNLRTA
jgi:expansin (peptidoglycan-binding protein)